MAFLDNHPPLSLRRLRDVHVVWRTIDGAARSWEDKIGALGENDLVIVLDQPDDSKRPLGMVRVLTRFGAGFITMHNFHAP